MTPQSPLTRKTLDKLNPKKALMQKAMQQLATMKAKDMFKMFQTKILPIFDVNSKVELKATKILLNDGKTWYAVLFRDVE